MRRAKALEKLNPGVKIMQNLFEFNAYKAKSTTIFLCLLCCFYSPSALAITLDASPQMQALSQRLIQKNLYTRERLENLLASVQIDQSVLKLFGKQSEARPWHEYRKIFINDERIAAGKVFLEKNRDLLKAAESKYGVPPHIISALIGVETFYGTRMGSRSVLRSLATLTAAYPRRADFFGKELETFLGLLVTEKLVADDVEGSYAGAIGIPQFMPSSYVAYAIDFNQNGRRDLVGELDDAVGSVANYLVKHGWERGAPLVQWIASPVKQSVRGLVKKNAKPTLTAAQLRVHGVNLMGGDKLKVSLNRLKEQSGRRYFLGHANFYALTRYNPSNKYAMAIVELSEAIQSK